MRISGNSTGGAVNPGVAQLERRIRQLEKRRERLMEQMGMKQSAPAGSQSQGLEQATVSVGNASIAKTGASAVTPVAAAETAQKSSAKKQPAASAPAATPAPASQPTADLSQTLQNLKQASSGGGGGGGDGGGGGTDLESLMKQIQLIDTQIMTLRQQMSEMEMADSMTEMATASIEDAVAAASGTEEPLPAPASDGDGHVDGYV